MNTHSLPRESARPVHVVGGGLAGCEAAWRLAKSGVPAILHEMRPLARSPAHQTDFLAELVCSNSFRSDDPEANAVGLMHAEMRRLGSLVMACADANQVPAGGALAVDRDGFAEAMTRAIASEPRIEIRREEVSAPTLEPDDIWILATGPLTSPALAHFVASVTGAESLSFFDAIAPIVHRDSVDMGKAWFQSRYDKVGPGGDGRDYLNCPLDREQYHAFVAALLDGEKTAFRDWEQVPYFDGCLPIEVMAERGPETLRHGPLKPFGLTNAHAPDRKPYAIVQLRQDNKLGTLYNMVGFQTKLKHGEQVRIFRTIPGLENAEFARLGGLHRNTYLNSPAVLDPLLRLRSDPRIRFAGQITGCEGYVESAAVGIFAGMAAAAEVRGDEFSPPPATTALGALVNHISGGHIVTIDAGPKSFQPMNVNFGLFPPLEGAVKSPDGKRLRGAEKARARKLALSQRAQADFDAWLNGARLAPAA